MSIDSNTVLTKTIGDHQLKAEISLCCVLHANYPFQIHVTLGAEKVFVYSSAHISNTSVQDMQKMFDSVTVHTCCNEGCDHPILQTESEDQSMQCSSCRSAAAKAEFAKAMIEIDREELEELIARKEQGMVYRTSIWIHAEFGDDEEKIVLSDRQLTKAKIQQYAKGAGSVTAKPDYSVCSIDDYIDSLKARIAEAEQGA
ncbi:hypothetical protein [Neptuniibacter halophilus]|uniref:hypothetical protein n=1 Tax=Neptuniibacter halophilus TaxID=651666 RepID=UPI0025745B64|nr:hypothetical protein [Neptuniibacter halophilus]